MGTSMMREGKNVLIKYHRCILHVLYFNSFVTIRLLKNTKTNCKRNRKWIQEECKHKGKCRKFLLLSHCRFSYNAPNFI